MEVLTASSSQFKKQWLVYLLPFSILDENKQFNNSLIKVKLN